MISDPRTSPDARLGRFLFAASVASLAHYLAFFMQMRPALYIALIATLAAHLLSIAICRRAICLEPAGQQGAPMKASSRLKTTVAVLRMLAAIAADRPRAFADSCGKAEAKLFQQASKVVLTARRRDHRDTMASDY
jgi:hypothetical protein